MQLKIFLKDLKIQTMKPFHGKDFFFCRDFASFSFFKSLKPVTKQYYISFCRANRSYQLLGKAELVSVSPHQF